MWDVTPDVTGHNGEQPRNKHYLPDDYQSWHYGVIPDSHPDLCSVTELKGCGRRVTSNVCKFDSRTILHCAERRVIGGVKVALLFAEVFVSSPATRARQEEPTE